MTVTPILVNLGLTCSCVTHANFLITLNFLSEETLGVFVPGVTFVPRLYLSIPNTLLSVGHCATADVCWRQRQQAPGFLGKKFTFHNIIVRDFQLLPALQVTFPRHEWDYSVFVFLE